ncbi:hypothetical protein F5144DRAFT_538531 [Chaetomium tenue]|uniref:Uncharacterized protein n=1 Tax=Chaetomium tenue TaxID=1854479 RepID=A0ACB7NZ37_9PEZI|nr:hypothetical protein F5144DRAFT_538531 [Chaetomium globosum]
MYNASLPIYEDYLAISEVHNVPASFEMSPATTTTTTTTTTTFPPTHLQIPQIATVSLVTEPPLLTSLSSLDITSGVPGALPRAEPDADLPPSKRAKLSPLDSQQRLVACLQRQVFPHVDSQVATLPKDRVNTLAIGKQVVALLTGQEFSREYNKRGDGTISLEFEARIAALAASHVESLARRLGHQLVPSHNIPPTPTPSPWPATPPQPQVESHQSFPESTPGLQVEFYQPPAAPSPVPRFSTSPIPVPTIPTPGRNGHARPNGTAAVSLPANTAIAPVGTLTTRPLEPRMRLPAGEAPYTSPKVVSPPLLAIRSSPVATRVPPLPASAPPIPLTLPPPVPLPPATTPKQIVQRIHRGAPQNWRKEAHALVWRGKDVAFNQGESSPTVRWPSEQRRPYLASSQRTSMIEGAQASIELEPAGLTDPVTFHVDFTTEEIGHLRTLTRRSLKLSRTKGNKDVRRDLWKVLRKNSRFVPSILEIFEREGQLVGRTSEDVGNFFQDLIHQKTNSKPAILAIRRDDGDRRGELIRSSRVHSLLFAREVSGQRLGATRSQRNFFNEFRLCREDALEKKAEWTGCAGDIFTIVWVSNDGFLCGTTEHSDAHNQQYNKPGNLVLGSCPDITLRAYPEHRIVRPVVKKGENSTDAMRQSQDPWLYSSVVSSDYDAVHDRAFTCSFDRTVKIWKVQKSGSSMSLLGEWKHDGNVNFVAASKHESGMVATAADVAADAVRIYSVDATNISRTPFRSHSCSRVTDERGNPVSTEKWAYYPATMQWGLAPNVRHLLLVGYSPRSRTGDDNDIPELRRDSGELCLWDGVTGERWRVTSATTQNVFEVLWHPSQDCFIAATSPLGLELEPSVRTQIRIFRPADQDEFGVKAYSPIKTLDCTAVDINELTIMPNSFSFCYITAGCTDGNTYVWDTARGDKPIHVLRHGQPIEEYRGDREREDVGVKFCAWGTTPDRFYTGSSDGVVKVWNIRSLSKPLVRNLLQAPAPITAGMFCPDKTRLVVGDASGRVFMFSIQEEKEQAMSSTQVPLPGAAGFKTIQRPPAITPHPDPPAPTHDAEGRLIVSESGPMIGRGYLNSLQLERHFNPTIGVVQGPRYAETGLFRRDMHFNEDPTQPLLAQWEAMQQEAWVPPWRFMSRRRDQGNVLRPLKEVQNLEERHIRNKALDLEVEALTMETLLDLDRDGVDLGLADDYLLEEEE